MPTVGTRWPSPDRRDREVLEAAVQGRQREAVLVRVGQARR